MATVLAIAIWLPYERFLVGSVAPSLQGAERSGEALNAPDMEELQSKPLFTKSRRYSDSQQDQALSEVPDTPLVLKGITFSDNVFVALVESASLQRSARLMRGQTLDGWTLNQINMEQATFVGSNGSKLRLNLN